MSEISVIVPCYNVESVLPRCLDALLRQTIPVDIILVNDGSTDNTAQVAQAYAQRHSNIRIVTKENQGLPQARKSGLAVADSPYVGFVDSDDWVEPEMYERLYQAVTRAGADIAACGMYNSYDDGREVTQGQLLEDGTVLTSREAFHYLHCRRDVFPYMWNKLYRRELLEGIAYPHGNFTGEDYVTQIQTLEKADRIVTVNASLYHYWQSSTSMSRGGFRDSHLLSYRHYREASAGLIAAHPEMEGDIHGYMAVEYMAYVAAMSRNNNYNTELLKSVQKYVRAHLISILKNKDGLLLYKGSAAVFSVHHRLFTAVYRILQQ